MLILKTATRATVLALAAFFAWTPAANAWSWPLQGPVVRAFAYDEANPYASGQHRGIDIGADAAGETVVAPAAGTVTFAGTVPTNGKTVTIETADGHSVTLTHLGSILVGEGAAVAERDPVGATGPSGTPEVDGPYVHLGIRATADPNGYLDPLDFLPPPADGGGTEGDTIAAQPSSSGTASSAPASEPAAPAPPSPRVATASGSTAAPRPSGVPVHAEQPAHESHADVRRPRTSRPRATHGLSSRPRLSRPTSSSRRPGVETAAPVEPAGLGAGHEKRSRTADAKADGLPSAARGTPLALALNGLAALLALGAALAAHRRRRHILATSEAAAAKVLHLRRPRVEHRRAA